MRLDSDVSWVDSRCLHRKFLARARSLTLLAGSLGLRHQELLHSLHQSLLLRSAGILPVIARLIESWRQEAGRTNSLLARLAPL